MQVMDNGGATQVKEIFTKTTIACSPSLPSPNMGQGMLGSGSHLVKPNDKLNWILFRVNRFFQMLYKAWSTR